MRRGLACALLLLVLAPSCARAGDRLGAGQDVDFCNGWGEFEALDEPDTRDRDATLRWGEGVLRILERIDTRREVDDDPVPERVKRTLKEAERTMESFVDDLKGTSTTDEVAVAVRRLADGRFDPAADSLTDFMVTTC